MNHYFNTIKRFNHNLRLFYAGVALHGFIFFGIYSLLLNLYLLRLGYAQQVIGLVNGVGPLVLAVSSIPIGLFSKRIGSRRGLMFGYIGMSIGMMAMTFSQLVPASMQAGWIIGTYAFVWLPGSAIVVNFAPFIMSQTVETERNIGFAILSSLFPVAGFAGNFVGGFLPKLFGMLASVPIDSAPAYRYALLFGGALYLLPAFLMWLTREPDTQAEMAASKSGQPVGSKPPIWLIATVGLVSLLLVTGDWLLKVYLNVYLDTVLNLPTARIGTLMGVARLFGLVAFVAPFVMSHFGLKRTLQRSAIAGSLLFLPLVLMDHWAVATVCFMAMTSITAIMQPAYTSFSQGLVEPEWRTTMSSAISTTMGIAIATVAFGGSSLITLFGFKALFIAGGLIGLIGALAFWIFFGKEKRSNPSMVLKPAVES
ncbi:MAG: MFS transporter [Chloroflexota bacterium]